MARTPYILFVDDDPAICAIFTRLFQRRLPLVHIIVLSSAAEAVALLDQQVVDLLITDHTMPGMTGLALVRQLRAQGAALPIVVISGLADLEREALQAGATCFLAKDMAVTELIPTVAAILHL